MSMMRFDPFGDMLSLRDVMNQLLEQSFVIPGRMLTSGGTAGMTLGVRETDHAFAIIFGTLPFVWPGATVAALVLVFAAYALVDGIVARVAALGGRGERRWAALILSGIALVIFGALLVALPLAGLLTLAWVIGSYALFFGVLLIGLAFRLRGMGNSTGSNRQWTA